MPEHRSSTSDERIVSISSRRRFEPAGGSAKAMPSKTVPPSPSLGDYERGGEPDDFRHRMVVNVIAFLFVSALVLAGVWLADTMATMRKTQDCLLAGKRGCAPVVAPAAPAR
jgi:hypothetical protein